MEFKIIFFSGLLAITANAVSREPLGDDISQLFLATKADLARSLLRKESEEYGDKKVVNVTHTYVAELNMTSPEERVRIFRSADENFFFTGSDLLQLQKEDFPNIHYVLNTVRDVHLDKGAVFFKTADWQNKTFFAVCYQQNFCEIKVSTSLHKINLNLRIRTVILPHDITFFGTHSDFYMVMVFDPVTIYKWTGTYFNEDYRLETTGAQSVAIIQDGEKLIFTVAQNLGNKKVYSKVFILQNDNIELYQLLPTYEALRVLSFHVSHRNEVLHYVFVLNNVRSSTIFWWTGKEFVHWKELDSIYGQRIVHVAEFASRMFFFISDRNTLYLYHPTSTTFDVMQIIMFDQNIVGIDVRKEKNQYPMLVTLTGSLMDPYFKINLLLLKVVFHDSEKIKKSSNGVLDCLTKVIQTLDSRSEKLNTIYKSVVRDGSSVLNSDYPLNMTVENLTERSIDEAMIELAELVEDMESRMDSLKEELYKKNQAKNYRIRGDLIIDYMKTDAIEVEILNDAKPSFENILSVTRDQTFDKEIDVETLTTDSLLTPSLNGILVNDILLKNKDFQNISGDFTINSLKAKDIKFGPSGRLNKIPVANIVTNKNGFLKPIKGLKRFSKLKVHQVMVNRINDVDATEWLSSVLPSFKDAIEEEPLNFTDLSVKELWVSKLNGIPWEEFMHSIFLPFTNKIIKGNLSLTGTARVKNLKSKKLNGISLLHNKDLMKKSAQFNSSCLFDYEMKTGKSFPFTKNPNKNDSFLTEALNESKSEFKSDIKYFPGKQKFTGDIRVSKILVRNPIELSGTKINMSDFPSQFWMIDEDQIIDVPVEFSAGCSIDSLSDVETINEISLDSFMRIDRPNEVLSKIVFDNVEIKGNVTLGHKAGQNFDIKNLNTSSAKKLLNDTLKISKHFMGKLKTKRLNVNFLNGMNMKELSNLKGSDFMHSDDMEISELVIGGDLIVKNKIQVNSLNGRNFSEVVKNVLTWNDSDVLSKAHFDLLTVENLEANTINGIDIKNKLPTLPKMRERNITVIIKKNLKVPTLQVNFINNINFDDFIKEVYARNSSEIPAIKGKKTFTEMVTITGNVQGKLNDYNVTELERIALSKSKTQEITGMYTVEEFRGNDVEADYIDDVSTSDLIFQDETSEQVINSDIVFNGVTVAGDIKAINFMSGCDLNKVGKIDFESIEEFENLLVTGNLTWENSNNKLGSLSYFLSNAVRKDDVQIISGPVIFENDVKIKSIEGSHFLNDVNLTFIAEDAVFKSQEEQEILATLTFKGPVKVNSITIENNILVDTINNIDITDIGQRLVKKNTDTLVTGQKIFKNGFVANHFNADIINGRKTNQIVFYDEVQNNKELFLPSATFENLVVFNDLTVSRVNGYRLSKIMEDRLLKTEDNSSEDNNIYGNVTVEGNITVKSHADVEVINDVNIHDIILAEKNASENLILGDIEFANDVSIEGKLEVDFMNGKNLTALYEKALMVDEDAVIEGSVEFRDDITVDGNIEVNNTLGECDFGKFVSIGASDETDDSKQDFQKKLREQINVLSNLTLGANKPSVFMYLEETTELDLQLPSMHSSGFNQYNEYVEFNIYGMKKVECGLPDDCYCPTQTNVVVSSLVPPSIRVEPNSTRFFKYFDKKMQVEVTVTTTTVSYSSRCKKIKEEMESEQTSISWRTFESDETIFELNIETGFLSDVKFFRLGDSIYAVMAFYFHPFRNETNNLHTVVYEIQVTNKSLEKVDEIPSSGVQVLEVFWTMNGVMLVVGNSFDSERYTDSVNSGVYRFNEDRKKFDLLRYVKTHGILAIKSMRYKKTSFIFFIQKQTWPLLILKYNLEYDNYYFSQKLDTTRAMIRSNFLSVSVISTESEGYSGDVFIGIVLSDDSFRLFKYKHIEGFVEESYQEQNNVRLLHPFWMGSSQYILAASTMDSSKIYEIIEQGR